MDEPLAPELLEVPVGRRERILAGVMDSLSAGLGIFPLGIALGLLVMQAGLPWWFAPALSAAAFAGSLELLLVGMVATVEPLAAVAVTVLVVNFRHVFYAFSFPLHLVRRPVARAYAVYAMIDESYAVQTALPPEARSSERLISMQLACEAYWVGGGLVGVLLASLLPGPIEGLEFALCALFVVLTLDMLRSSSQVPSLLLAGLAATGALLLAPRSAVLVALLAFVGSLLVRYLLTRRNAGSFRA
ncbi:AzlC family ABC transporter permease [Oerskovia enterophila]